MENKTPKLEEVKAYFKNAKEVRCLSDNKIYNIENIKRDFHFFYGDIWICTFKHVILMFYSNTNEYAEIISYKDETPEKIGQLETPKHYDNSKGTLYKVATERGWNSYLFDIVKRLERAEKKGEFKTDLEKSINVIKLWLQEYEVKK